MKKETQQEFFYAGIPTFAGADYIEIDECKNYDVAVIGVPYDDGASYREGCKKAPRKIREYSSWKRFDKAECYDYDNRRYAKTNVLKIGDLGDINIFKGSAVKTQDEITNVVKEIAKSTFPVILGGDHSITYGAYKGVKAGTGCKKLGLIQFDAHNDTEPEDEHLPEICHCTQFPHLINEGYLNGTKMVTIGLRGFVDRRWHDFALEKGINIITANEFNAMECEEVLEYLKEKLEGCDGVYVTFDMDSLEAAYSEGTGTPKYNGLKVMKVLNLLRRLNELDVKAFDLVELCPDYDATGITGFMSWEVLNNFLSFGYNKKEESETKNWNSDAIIC